MTLSYGMMSFGFSWCTVTHFWHPSMLQLTPACHQPWNKRENSDWWQILPTFHYIIFQTIELSITLICGPAILPQFSEDSERRCLLYILSEFKNSNRCSPLFHERRLYPSSFIYYCQNQKSLVAANQLELCFHVCKWSGDLHPRLRKFGTANLFWP